MGGLTFSVRMGYNDAWERERDLAWAEWRTVRWWKENSEFALHPDERLDDIGWSIFFYLVQRGVDEWDAAAQAMDGNLRQRRRVLRDHQERYMRILRRRYDELHPASAGLNIFDSQAPDQLAFWGRNLPETEYVYFIQSGSSGPVKIGLSADPERRTRQLQTGNPHTLELRHVIPGNVGIERQLHVRFAPARIRGEWFGRQYLAVILAFAGGLANELAAAYDGDGKAPLLINGTTIRTTTEIERIRSDLNRLYVAGHTNIMELSQYTGLDPDEIEHHLTAMRKSPVYDVSRQRRSPVRPSAAPRQRRPVYRWGISGGMIGRP